MKMNGSSVDASALLRDNARLAHQNKKLQEIVEALKEEVSDANTEIAALTQLFEEQKALLAHELHNERQWRESLQKEIARQRDSKVSIATMTNFEVGTSTIGEVAVGTDDVAEETPHGPSSQHGFARRELGEFSEWLARHAHYHGPSLAVLFDTMGASTVVDVCSTISEKDLLGHGVSIVKARSIMHLIREHTAALLSR